MIEIPKEDLALMQGGKNTFSDAVLDFIIEFKKLPHEVLGYDEVAEYRFWKFKVTRTIHKPGIKLKAFLAILKRMKENNDRMKREMKWRKKSQ